LLRTNLTEIANISLEVRRKNDCKIKLNESMCLIFKQIFACFQKIVGKEFSPFLRKANKTSNNQKVLIVKMFIITISFRATNRRVDNS